MSDDYDDQDLPDPEVTLAVMQAEANMIGEEIAEIEQELARLKRLSPPTQDEIEFLLAVDRDNARRGIIDDSHWKARGFE